MSAVLELLLSSEYIKCVCVAAERGYLLKGFTLATDKGEVRGEAKAGPALE